MANKTAEGIAKRYGTEYRVGPSHTTICNDNQTLMTNHK